VWAPATRTFVPIGASACVKSTGTGAGLQSVALAGKQVAYVQFAGGNTRELQLRLATLARPRSTTVASAAYGVDTENGTYIGRVAGDGSLLAFDWWMQCGPCALVNPVAPRSSIWRIVTAGSRCPESGGLGTLPRCRPVEAAPGSLRLLAVGGGLVAMGSGDDFVEVRRADGTPLYSGFFPGTVRAARLDGGALLVHTRSGTQNSLWSVNTQISDGRRSGPWTLPSAKSLRVEDFQSGIAVYVVGRDVHLLRLADKHDQRIRAPGTGPVHAQLEAPGLFYSYRPPASPGRGRVAFLPISGS
jgi:hypothetical protein